MAASELPDLLFLDTFSHDTSEELNLDLVQFPKSVFVREIRIIPLGARVEGDFPGGVRLGATNPTKFHIDFFVNDLSKPGACTFEGLGSIDYCQNGQIHMECEAPSKIPTDGLVLKGCYTTITLAVYGNLTQVISESPRIAANPPQIAPKQSLPRDVTTVSASSVQPPPEWNQGPTNPIPTYTGNVATVNPEPYGPSNYPENYEQPVYRSDYYEADAPKDPRMFHTDSTEWEKERIPLAGEKSPRLDERDRERREGRSRRRSINKSRESSRHRDRSVDRIRSRSRSRDRDYIVKGEYRPLSRSRSRSIDRERHRSVDRDWDRSSFKKDDFRRRRGSSYDRSRAGSYDNRSGSYDRRSPFDKRPSYERKRLSPYEKRGSSYERRAPSYEKQYDKKRHSPYNRIRRSSFGSRSPSRDDPRKRPRTPGEVSRRPISPRDSKASPIRPEDDFDRSGKQIPRVEFYHQTYRHKSSIRSPSQEAETPSYDAQNSTLVTVPIVDNPPKPTIESPIPNPEDEKSMDAEQFEPILSDEDICDDIEPSFMDVDYEINDYCDAEDIIKYFNPFKTEWTQYENVNKVHLLAKVRHDNVKDVLNATFDELCDLSPDLFKISEITKTAKGREEKFIASTFTEIDNINREDWVHQCEQIIVSLINLCTESDIILRIFQSKERKDEAAEFVDMFELLLTFCKIGLDFDFALAQQQPTYKIRHMKCGIRLAEALLSHRFNSIVITKFLNAGIDISMLLLEMYSKEYMALSIRLMILKSLNACLSSKEAIEHFMNEASYPKLNKKDTNKPKNGFEALVSILKADPLVRIKFSVSSLIKKLNIYELLSKLQQLVLDFNKKTEGNNDPDDLEFTEKDTEFIVDSLNEILHMYRSQCFHISQPKRFLPVSAQFDINKDCSNEVLLDFFKAHQFLEICLYLLTSPSTSNNLVITSPIYDLLHELIFSRNGLNYLYSNMDISELLFKTLMHPYGQNPDEYLYPHDLNNYNDLQILGLELAYRLRALYLLKSICDLQAGKVDENELIDRLQSLYCLSFGSIGKIAVPDVIVMGDNAECLMEVFERDSRSRSKSESPSKQKSPAKGYSIELIVLAVRFSANVPFLKKYGPRILNVAKEHEKFEPSVSSVLQEVVPYLKPIEKNNAIAGDEMIADCVEILKASAEHAPDLPGELMTCLRILRHYCISDYETNASIVAESATEEYVELKYKYNILQLFSLDGVAHLAAILDKIATHFDQPSMHTAFFASVKGLQLTQTLLPCLRLLDEMLARVVKCRGSRFRDLTAAPVLLKTYGIVKTYPVGSVGYRTATKAAEAAVKALLAYSQPIADDATDGDSIRKGPWTSLCSEVISYTMTAPYTFVSGLLVFSELLPLPLPMQSKTPPLEREIADATNERRLWSAHLYALSNDLTDMIQIICMSTYRPVVHMLRRVCVQIADLAPNTAATVAKAAIGAVTRELKPTEPCSASAARVLGFLACLVSHAPVKCAVLHAMNTSAQKPSEIQTALCDVLSLSHSSSEHCNAQEFAAHAIAALCDAEVSLTPSTAPVDTIISNSLPNKDLIVTILDATADCLKSSTKTTTVVSSILRAYFVLSEHEFGFQQFRKFVNKRREDLGNFFKWILDNFGEEKVECLSLYLDLIRILKSEEGEGPMGRKSLLTVNEVADLVGFTVRDEEHPVHNLEKIFKERNTDEEAISNAQFLSSTLEKLKEEEDPSSPTTIEEPTYPATESLVAQFGSRTVYTIGEASDERLTAGYWLNVPSIGDDDVNDNELVSCNISMLASALLSPCSPDAVDAALRRLAGAGGPARGGRGRPVVVSRGRGECDSFRCRPPNTSRPPSLHVDDFTALAHPAPFAHHNRGNRRGAGQVSDRGRYTPHTHYRLVRGRGAWEMGAQHYGHFPPTSQYGVMPGMGWGGSRMQRGVRHRSFMR